MLQLLLHLDKTFKSLGMFDKCLHVSRTGSNAGWHTWIWPIVCYSFACFPCVQQLSVHKCKSGECEALSCLERSACLSVFIPGRLATCIACFPIVFSMHAVLCQFPSTMQIQAIKRVTENVFCSAKLKLLNGFWGVMEEHFQSFKCLRAFIFVPHLFSSEFFLWIITGQAAQSLHYTCSTYKNSKTNNAYTCCVIWTQLSAAQAKNALWNWSTLTIYLGRQSRLWESILLFFLPYF